MSAITRDGARLPYTDVGSGIPLVLVHGHPFDRSMWQPQLDYFGDRGFRVIAPDLRGYGEATVAGRPIAFGEFAHDIAALLQALELERAVLGGLSMGGQIVLEFHRLYRERVLAMILADTSAPAETPEGKEARRRLAERVLAEGMRPYAEEVLPMMVAPANVDALPHVANHVLTMMLATDPTGAAAALRARAERPDYVTMLTEVEVPTLVVVGSEDEFTPLAAARLIADSVTGAELVVVDGAGHLPNLERPDAFNRAVEEFLAGWLRDP